jgi:hypothetical protein
MRLIPRLAGLFIAGGLLLAVMPPAAPARAITLPPPTGTLRVTYDQAAVVAANQVILIAAADNRGNIDSWSQRYGAATWTFQRVATASGGVSYSTPVVTWAGGNVVIAATDTGGGLDSWYQWQGTGTSWTPDQVATGGYRSPAITATGSSAIDLTAIGPAGNVDFWSQPSQAATWSAAQQVVPASKAGSYSAPSIAWASPGTVVTATLAGQIETWSQATGSTAWTADPGPSGGYGSAVITATPSDDQFEVAAVSQTGITTAWNAPVGLAGWSQPEPAGTVTQPAIAAGLDLVIAGRDSSGNLWSYFQPSGTMWTPLQVTYGGHTYSAPRLAGTPGAMYLVATDNDGDVEFWSDPDSGTWTQEQVAAAT